MKTIKTTMMIASVISALALAAPIAASAAPDHDGRYAERGYEGRGYEGRGYERHGYEDRGRFDDRGYWRSFDARINELRGRLEMGRRNGALTNREYRRLNERLDSIAWQKTKFQRTGRGLDRHEASVIDEKLDHLSMDIRYQRHDNDRNYGRGYGR